MSRQFNIKNMRKKLYLISIGPRQFDIKTIHLHNLLYSLKTIYYIKIVCKYF